MTQAVTVDVVSDVICPWCFLGKRRLDKAVASLEGFQVDVKWRPFLLDASIPKQDISREVYLKGKFGSTERITELHKPLLAAGATDGIDFAFDKIKVTPNTLDAHRLIRWAHVQNLQTDMAERLFTLYWIEGADIGSHDVLISAAADVGLSGALVAQLLKSEADLDPIIAEINQAAEFGITGVPTYIIANRYAVVGAQPPDVLKSGIMRAMLEQRAPKAVN